VADSVTMPKSSSDDATCRVVMMHPLPPQGQVQTLTPHTLTHLVSLRLTTLRHRRSRQVTRTEARTQIRKLHQVTRCPFCACVIALQGGILLDVWQALLQHAPNLSLLTLLHVCSLCVLLGLHLIWEATVTSPIGSLLLHVMGW